MDAQREEEADASDDEHLVWPPRPDQVPRFKYAAADAAELHLGLDTTPPEEPSFAPSRLSACEQTKVEVGVDSATHVVVFDPRNPSGRTRRDEILDANDDDFHRRHRRRQRQSALAGTFIFVLCIGAFFRPTLFHFALATSLGTIAGITAERLGDRSETWLLACLVGGLALSPLMAGPQAFLVIGGLAAGGWLTGFVRELS